MGRTSEWRVEPGDLTRWTKVMRGSEKDGDLEIVAKTYAIEGHTATDVANLIAAAPELLAALREIADECNRRLRKGEDSGDRLTLQLCKAAIAKAEGRSE